MKWVGCAYAAASLPRQDLPALGQVRHDILALVVGTALDRRLRPEDLGHGGP
jgi:hypothetical protein